MGQQQKQTRPAGGSGEAKEPANNEMVGIDSPAGDPRPRYDQYRVNTPHELSLPGQEEARTEGDERRRKQEEQAARRREAPESGE